MLGKIMSQWQKWHGIGAVKHACIGAAHKWRLAGHCLQRACRRAILKNHHINYRPECRRALAARSSIALRAKETNIMLRLNEAANGLKALHA